ncbi:MAG: DUF1109 domain-containing protein [Rhodocyclaceae bacterium]|nr:DUF1109 domain-containing protein [Rhodocyclaceae bacterium]
MKTDDFALMLATGAGAVDTNPFGRRFGIALAAGSGLALLQMTVLIGIRSDLADALAQPDFWIKLGFSGALMAAALALVLRLSSPGAALGRLPGVAATPVLAIWALAAGVLMGADPARWPTILLGETWAVCPFLIAFLSIPMFVATFWAMRDLAPTRLRLAGAAAGLFSGATGAVAYSLHCPEMAYPFVGTWYVLGILMPVPLGTYLGPRLLRW